MCFTMLCIRNPTSYFPSGGIVVSSSNHGNAMGIAARKKACRMRIKNISNPNRTQVGIFMRNGSGGFVSGLRFTSIAFGSGLARNNTRGGISTSNLARRPYRQAIMLSWPPRSYLSRIPRTSTVCARKSDFKVQIYRIYRYRPLCNS